MWHTRLRLVCHFFVLTKFWRHLWSIAEQTHGNLESICWIDCSNSVCNCGSVNGRSCSNGIVIGSDKVRSTKLLNFKRQRVMPIPLWIILVSCSLFNSLSTNPPQLVLRSRYVFLLGLEEGFTPIQIPSKTVDELY